MTVSRETFQEQFVTTYGFNPLNCYCSMTGKPIATIDSDEFDQILAQLETDLEIAIDDFAIRSVASMRPSLKWNKLRTESLTDMRRLAPVETMSYLLNRLFQPLATEKDAWFETQLNRIRLFDKLCKASPHSPEQWDSLMLMLLELEAKLQLITESSPITCKQVLGHADPIGFMLESFKPWHEKRIAFHTKAEQEAQFFASNPGARRAYFTAWMESSPPSEATIQRREVQAGKNLMAGLLDEIMGKGADKTSAMRPVVHEVTRVVLPSTKMPKRFGVKQ